MFVTGSPPIPDAAYAVTCRCGYAYSSNANTPQDAIIDVAKRGHQCADMAFRVEPFRCDDCGDPLRLHKRAVVVKSGQAFGLCKKCLLQWAKTGVL